MPQADLQAEIQRYVPIGRFGNPEEIAAAILFVCSSQASYLNGAIIPVDAGLGSREAGPA
jgi:NAD(P)-dependent dehydrogenase (short-subunit alcohol dehydrogenase family)